MMQKHMKNRAPKKACMFYSYRFLKDGLDFHDGMLCVVGYQLLRPPGLAISQASQCLVTLILREFDIIYEIVC